MKLPEKIKERLIEKHEDGDVYQMPSLEAMTINEIIDYLAELEKVLESKV